MRLKTQRVQLKLAALVPVRPLTSSAALGKSCHAWGLSFLPALLHADSHHPGTMSRPGLSLVSPPAPGPSMALAPVDTCRGCSCCRRKSSPRAGPRTGPRAAFHLWHTPDLTAAQPSTMSDCAARTPPTCHTRTRTRTHTYTYTHTCRDTHTHPYTYTRTHTYTERRTHTHPYTYIHTCTDTHTYLHTYRDTHTDTHTHTLIYTLNAQTHKHTRRKTPFPTGHEYAHIPSSMVHECDLLSAPHCQPGHWDLHPTTTRN